MKQVIIIGAGRSGTKFLRGIIAASHLVEAVPYDVNYIWREGNESRSDDELLPESIGSRQRQRIRSSLYAQAGLEGREEGILVEKSVPNSLRVPFVDAVFPEALYIHLIRDGRQVVESAYRNWKSGPDTSYLVRKLRTFPLRNWRYALWYARNLVRRLAAGPSKSAATWGPRYKGIDEDVANLPLIQVVARQWVRCVEHSQTTLDQIPVERRIEIRYEELVNGEDCIRKVAAFVGLPDVDQVVEKFRASVKPPSRNGWLERLSEEERRLALDELSGTLRNLGYD